MWIAKQAGGRKWPLSSDSGFPGCEIWWMGDKRWEGAWVRTTLGRVSPQVPCPVPSCSVGQGWAEASTQVQPSPQRLQSGGKTDSQTPNCRPGLQAALGDQSGGPRCSPLRLWNPTLRIWLFISEDALRGREVRFIHFSLFQLWTHRVVWIISLVGERKHKLTHVSALWYGVPTPTTS